MKKIKCIILAIASLFMLAGCGDDGGTEYRFRGVVNTVSETELEVTVTLSAGANFGDYRVLLTKKTEYYYLDGTKIARESIEVGDVIEIAYNGQVMRSMPPQVVALKIIVAAKGK